MTRTLAILCAAIPFTLLPALALAQDQPVIDGDRLVAGAPGYNGSGVDRGTAYVFERDTEGVWKPTAQLFPSDPEDFDDFGVPIALDGDVLAVAAPRKDTDAGFETGVVYVFERAGGGAWTEVARLMAPDAES